MRTIEQVLAELRALAERAQRGEDVSQRRAEVEQELAALGYQPAGGQQQQGGDPQGGQQQGQGQGQGQQQQGAPQGGGQQQQQGQPGGTAFGGGASLSVDERAELELHRQRQREHDMRSAAEQFATTVQTVQQSRQAQDATQMADLIQQALGSRGLVPANGQDPVLQAAVVEALKNVRGGSRYIGPNGDEGAAQHLAAGGSFGPDGQPLQGGGYVLGGGVNMSDPSALQAGTDRGVKEIEDSKSLGRLMSIVSRAHKAPWTLRDAEERWLRDQSQKAMAQGTDTAGGFLVPQEWMPDILGLVRSNAVVRRANPRVVPFNKQMNQTSISTGSTAYYTQENARIPTSEMTFAQAPILTPKYLTALVPVSNYLLGNADAVDTLVRDDMIAALTTREDLAFLQGTGVGGEPTGFRNIGGLILNPLAPGANGFTPTLPDLRRIKGRTRMAQASGQNPRWTWFFHPSLLTYLETLTDTMGRFLVDTSILTVNADGVSGTFDGIPFYASYQIPTTLTIGTSTNATYILLVDMNQAILGESTDLQIDVSNEATYSPDGGTTHISAFQQNQTVFRVIIGHDINHRVPARGVIDQEGVLV